MEITSTQGETRTSQPEDVWLKNENKQSSLEPDETLTHTFWDTKLKDKTIKFGIRYPLSNKNPETEIVCWEESKGNDNFPIFDVKGGTSTAKLLVGNVINHLDQKYNININDVRSCLSSRTMEQHQEAELRNPQEYTGKLMKKAGYVQGVCECVAAIGEDHNLGKKLLSEMQITKDLAKKFASPETYKALEQGIFAPQQNLEQTHSIKR